MSAFGHGWFVCHACDFAAEPPTRIRYRWALALWTRMLLGRQP